MNLERGSKRVILVLSITGGIILGVYVSYLFVQHRKTVVYQSSFAAYAYNSAIKRHLSFRTPKWIIEEYSSDPVLLDKQKDMYRHVFLPVSVSFLLTGDWTIERFKNICPQYSDVPNETFLKMKADKQLQQACVKAKKLRKNFWRSKRNLVISCVVSFPIGFLVIWVVLSLGSLLTFKSIRWIAVGFKEDNE